MASASQLKHLISWWPACFDLDPDLIPDEIKFAIAFGEDKEDYALFVTKNDQVYGVGKNSKGCLGVGDTTERMTPTRVAGLCGKKLAAIGTGYGHVLAVSSDGQVYLWGDNKYYQLGNNTTTPAHTPQLCRGLENHRVKQVACGGWHSLALTESSQIYAWGLNSFGQIGTGNAIHQSTPRAVRGLRTREAVRSICCCYHSSFALTAGGEIYGWGCNEDGEVGILTKANQLTPQRVGGQMDVVFKSMACGSFHVLGLTDDGRVLAWGRNNFGQAGVGTTAPVLSPTHVDLGSLRAAEVGAIIYSHLSTALTSCRKVFAWGKSKSAPILKPKLSTSRTLHEAFLLLSSPVVSPKPLVPVDDKEDEDEDEDETKIRSCLQLHFDNEEVSDISFAVEGRTLHGHVSFLRMRSPYLRAMLGPSWTERQRMMEIKGQTYQAFRTYLQYLYTDTVEVSAEDAMDVLQLADEYCEAVLKRQCEKVVRDSITVDNVFTFYDAALKCSAEELENFCLKFASAHLTAATNTEAYRQLDPRVAQEFFVKASRVSAFKF